MKMALCFYGFLRSFPATIDNWKRTLIDDNDIDIFMTCPNTYYANKEIDDFNGTNDITIVDECSIRKSFGSKLKVLKIRNYDASIFQNQVNKNNVPEQFLHQKAWRSFSTFYGIQQTIIEKQEYQKYNNINYDVVFLSRPDLILHETPNIKDLDFNKVYYGHSHISPIHGTSGFFGDHIMISSNHNINIAADIYASIVKYSNLGVPINNETLFGHHFTVNNIPFEHNNFVSHHLV